MSFSLLSFENGFFFLVSLFFLPRSQKLSQENGFFFFFKEPISRIKPIRKNERKKERKKERTHHGRLQVVADPDRQDVGRRGDHLPDLRRGQPQPAEKLHLGQELPHVVGQQDGPLGRDAGQRRPAHAEAP